MIREAMYRTRVNCRQCTFDSWPVLVFALGKAEPATDSSRRGEETIMTPWRAGLLAATILVVPAMAYAQTPKPATGSLTVAYAAEATMMDPAKYAAGVDQYFFGQIFEQLVRSDPDLKRVNWLAEKWELKEENGKPYLDIHIRKGVKFHNGDPLTSADFEFSYSRLRDNKVSRWSHLQAAVEKFEVIDDHHFLICFKEGDGSYIADNLQLWAMPKKYFEKVGDEEFAKKPVGTGPWKFVSRTIKEEIKFEAFDDYWNKEHRPTVKNLTIKMIPEDLTRVAAFKTGAVDWIDAVPPAMVEEFKKMPGVKTQSFVTPQQSLHSMYRDPARTRRSTRCEGAPGGGPCDRRRRDHQERVVRPGRALRPSRQGHGRDTIPT